MPNLRMFGSPIHDTAISFIASSTLTSLFFYFGDGEINRSEANYTILIGVIFAFFYWFSQYKTKK